jgi:hypothetical protein
MILFAPATFIYMSARSEQRQRLFAAPELLVALAITIAALIAIRELVTGGISI